MMAVFHQMGHHSANLLECDECQRYRGAILSPVNYAEEDIGLQIERLSHSGFEMVLDPQLYYPQSDRGLLATWQYFPEDADTADPTLLSWWHSIVDSLMETVRRIRPTAVCAPAVVPRQFNDEYYHLMFRVAQQLTEGLCEDGISVLPTILLRMEDLAIPDRSAQIASIATSLDTNRAYLVFITTADPRREIRETEEIKGAMRLLSYLEGATMSTLVGFSSSDLLLWKFAGAADVASGKFFNLRRFTESRFAPPPEGGGQVPYWFEESLMAFLRESDLVRVRQAELLSESSLANPAGRRILEKLDTGEGEAWLADSWRQFLWWFDDFERRWTQGDVSADPFLEQVEWNWRRLEDARILMEEPANDGGWIRPWRRAVLEAF